MKENGCIGVFDSGLGGLTVLRALREELPQYRYVYLGDNARAPYGSHSFDTIYRYTRECVSYLFGLGCPLVILACNTASARALRTLQQRDLPLSTDPSRRILGVIRPTVEALSGYTHTRHVGIVGTEGTIRSRSYPIEIAHLFPDISIYQQACPMWVPLVENGEVAPHEGTRYFLARDLCRLLAQSDRIDTILLGCTHYPLLLPLLRDLSPRRVRWLSQGEIVACSLKDYLKRHPEMDSRLDKSGGLALLTTGSVEGFVHRSKVFESYYPLDVPVESVFLGSEGWLKTTN